MKILYKGKNAGGKGREGSFQVLAALTTLSLALSQVYKTSPRSLVVETVGMVWVFGRLWDGRV